MSRFVPAFGRGEGRFAASLRRGAEAPLYLNDEDKSNDNGESNGNCNDNNNNDNGESNGNCNDNNNNDNDNDNGESNGNCNDNNNNGNGNGKSKSNGQRARATATAMTRSPLQEFED